jgi:hypothetical protein
VAAVPIASQSRIKKIMAAVFLAIEKDFDNTWHPSFLFKLSKLEFSNSLIRLISSHLSQIIFRVSVEGEISTPREVQAGVPQGSILPPTLCSTYINYTPQTPGVYLAFFVDDTCIYATDYK